ncbi:protein NRT1/ PTR FAMILY 5.2-like [Diospyros lotus]|uniref:protein NRT1/ PTR FAMILY 5.2-like n=1 Tax=Diospyros lotus TaxID=55363 RepID=UPI0022538447|nr:protein NRT1/ PTR FAMILY 5.2-like [Diospyros lotus]XP_052207471.1 protein NRT1/ PTR FAMILY 5.2-like [Diospyros lotus]
MVAEEPGSHGYTAYTEDGTVDLKGNPVLRSKRGRWRACFFVVVCDAFEAMAYQCISSNMINYLTKKLAVGTGGTKPNTSTIGADQFDETDPKEKAQKASFFNWWTFIVSTGTVFANTVLVYVQDNVGWTLGYGIPTAGLSLSILILLAGKRFYRHREPTESPFTRMTKVIVAAARKWKVPVPGDPREPLELDLED